MSVKVSVSVAVITKNEESRLRPCLESVSWAADIVVVDSGSTDRTVELARSMGARVFVEEWKGFGPQKQSAIDKCANDTVLILDADERLSPEAAARVKSIIESGLGAEAYSFRRKSHIGGRWIRHSGWWPDRVPRLIDRRQCRMQGLIHERVVINGTTIALDEAIEHFTFEDYSSMIVKMNSYSDMTSDDIVRSGRRVGPLAPSLRAAWTFIRVYLLRRGFLDGFDGLVIALLNAGGTFFKYAKARRKQA